MWPAVARLLARAAVGGGKLAAKGARVAGKGALALGKEQIGLGGRGGGGSQSILSAGRRIAGER